MSEIFKTIDDLNNFIKINRSLYSILNYRVLNNNVSKVKYGIILGYKYKNILCSSYEEFDKIPNKSVNDVNDIKIVVKTLNINDDISEIETLNIDAGNIHLVYYEDSKELLLQYYSLLVQHTDIKFKIKTDITSSTNLFGLIVNREKIKDLNLKYKLNYPVLVSSVKANKKVLVFIVEYLNKNYKFLADDIEILFPSLIGYNAPKDKTIRINRIVTIVYSETNGKIENNRRYIINDIFRTKCSSRLKNQSSVHKLDILRLTDLITGSKTLARAKDIKVL